MSEKVTNKQNHGETAGTFVAILALWAKNHGRSEIYLSRVLEAEAEAVVCGSRFQKDGWDSY